MRGGGARAPCFLLEAKLALALQRQRERCLGCVVRADMYLYGADVLCVGVGVNCCLLCIGAKLVGGCHAMSLCAHVQWQKWWESNLARMPE
jgi:hypothetical protein